MAEELFVFNVELRFKNQEQDEGIPQVAVAAAAEEIKARLTHMKISTHGCDVELVSVE